MITFLRAADSSGVERTFYVVGERALDDLADEEPTDEATDEQDEATPWEDYELPTSLPTSEYELMGILQGAGLVSGGTYASALRQLELPFIFAGREQWVRNVQGEGVEDEPRLWDVSMQSILHEPHAQRLLLGRTVAAAEYRGPQAAQDDLSYWESLVPAWAPEVRDTLADMGVPFSVELLASPEINLTDPSKPLFARGEAPGSLFQLGVLQQGENGYLRSISASELMLEVWPAYWRFHHRPAGAPVPEDLRAGLTFGSPVLLADGTYLRSPVLSTSSYRRWMAYDYPGYNVDEDAASLTDYNPSGYGPLFYFTGPYEVFAPWNLDEATIARYDLLLRGK